MSTESKPREFFGLSNPMRSSSATGNAFPFWENEKSAIQEKEWGWRGDLIHVIEKSAYDKAAGALKKYGQHTKECICHMGHAAYENACDCGFDEALKDLERS